MRKILLNKSNSKNDVNKEVTIPIDFNRDTSLIHDELLRDTLDTMQLYNDERDKSKKYRLIFTIYPICSNVLFNNITEIVYKEGYGKETTVLDTSDKKAQLIKNLGAISTSKLTRQQAIRNTEYTNDVFNLTYHCGSDIFNNHLLRAKNNVSVQKKNFNNTSVKRECEVLNGEKFDPFNTIGDYSRTYEGNDIKIKMPTNEHYTYASTKDITLPLYTYDEIKSFFQTFSDELKRKDGWLGFNNKTTMKISVKKDEKYYVNKCFNNKPSCQFIDMAPERDLFYFTPKKNIHKNRLEHNWDLFITYPYKSIYNDGILLNGSGLPIEHVKDYIDNDITLTMFKCPTKHNLSVGNDIKFSDNSVCKVVKVGDSEGKYKDRYFSVRKEEYSGSPVMFKKIVNGFECEYYFRKFKKIKVNGKNLKNTINKLAFSETIYGDDVSQLVFTDDIDVENLRDNRNRPITELFLTILKTNRGHDLWYESSVYTGDTIEYSHVFGKVTSGLDLPTYAGKEYPTLRYQHNIKNGNGYKSLSKGGVKITNDSSCKMEDDITNAMDEFYGDLVEYNPINVTETILEDVYHRFNTAQREYYNSSRSTIYDTIYYDEIYSDIYDNERYGKDSLNKISTLACNSGYANLAPEGYIYKPHFRIKIAEYDNLVHQNSDFIMDVKNINFVENESLDYDLIFYTDINYSLNCGDNITFFNLTNKRYFTYTVTKFSKNNDEKGKFFGEAKLSKTCYELTENDKNGSLKWFINNTAIPEYAAMLPDASGRRLWMGIKKPSEMTFMDDLNDVPYTNGSFYHHKNIIFSVKRQDPFGEYEMYVTNNGVKIENNFEMPSIEFDDSEYEHFDINTNDSSCF